MNKEEAIQLHDNLTTLKEFFVLSGKLAFNDLEEYQQLNVRPSHTDKSRDEHMKAVFTLGNIMAESMDEGEFSNARRIARRMNDLADDVDID